MNFYEAINETNINTETWLHTVVEGEHAGEKAVVSGGIMSWASDDQGVFTSHVEETVSVADSGLAEIDGARVYSELLGKDKKLVICGAGHVSMQIISIGRMLGFHVTVIDDRLQFANNAITYGADEVKFKEHARREFLNRFINKRLRLCAIEQQHDITNKEVAHRVFFCYLFD